MSFKVTKKNFEKRRVVLADYEFMINHDGDLLIRYVNEDTDSQLDEQEVSELISFLHEHFNITQNR